MDTIKPTTPDAERTCGSLHRDCSATTWKVEKRFKKGRWKHHGYQAKESDARRDMNALVAEGWYGARFHLVKKSLNTELSHAANKKGQSNGL